MVISPQLNYKSYIFEFITIKIPTVVVVGATYFYQNPRDQFPTPNFYSLDHRLVVSGLFMIELDILL